MAHPLLTTARAAILASLEGTPFLPPELGPPWTEARPVFVTLTEADGALRGCMGHLAARFDTLAEEVATTAVLAATEDPRFDPVEAAQLQDLQLEVSVLEAPERVTDRSQLDPRRYGVVVTWGARRGVLLPDLEGVDTVEQQLAIARRKGGIPDTPDVRIDRFEVTKVP